ncbi:hypothetical protein ABID82_005790 [Methylobacterium sp. PvP062]|uniref:Glycosyl transferase CAP10 domain-containing protein n=1 Tax=Methylobacterium radiotolerans TaxID=31998 RepID=A0ABV2N9F3_9HYPH|nr:MULTISPECIES: glycosyl transferase family 90 [unclassified Methylobacterium]MBP2493627.1 hypothetical protein [Methylobacterium sp. PvP105]MBP2500000.1 hypothetical protein [Methylobacterium sp. PvP109]
MLTREEVIDSFRLLLKRDPESDFAIEHHRHYDDVGLLLLDLMKSDEFDVVRRRGKSRDLTEFALIDRGFERGGLSIGEIKYAERSLHTVLLNGGSQTGSRRADLVPVGVEFSTHLMNCNDKSEYKKIAQRRLGSLMEHIGPAIGKVFKHGNSRLAIDFGDHGTQGHISMDRPAGTDWPLMPDLYMLKAARDPIEQLTKEEFYDNFVARSLKLFWRGSTTGGTIRSEEDLLENYRVKCCLLIKEIAGDKADCKIARVAQVDAERSKSYEASLERLGLLGSYVREEEFAKYAMYIDMPGNAAGWGTCLKYMNGCLILRPPQSRELAYTPLLRPWTHFIPVNPDMSDVGTQIDWVAHNIKDAADIAWQGYQLIREFLRDTPEYLSRLFSEQNRAHHDLLNH